MDFVFRKDRRSGEEVWRCQSRRRANAYFQKLTPRPLALKHVLTLLQDAISQDAISQDAMELSTRENQIEPLAVFVGR